MRSDAFRELVTMLEHGRVVVLSGAGLSTESGIPDYRGPDGTRRVQPMSIQEFRGSSAARARYWARSYVGWPVFCSARPNAGHQAVTALQKRGVIDSVITQNVDGLHQRAGSVGVVELHGTLSQVCCLTCGERADRQWLQEQIGAANPGFRPARGQLRPDGDVDLSPEVLASFVVPRCVVCGQDTLKPDVVFYGDAVPKSRVQTCYELVAQACSLLVLGSSLQVMSGLRFVKAAARAGIPVGIVTLSATRGDEYASTIVHAPLGELLPDLLAQMDSLA